MILLTGGTGFVGQEVVEALLARGHRVRLLVRKPERAARFQRQRNVELCVGDALRPDTLAPAMEGVEAVIHLIGIIAETRHLSFEQAHVEATAHVLQAAQQAGVTRWLQMSAIGSRLDARSRYHITKAQAEELVHQSGMDWTIFQPSLIYGHDDRDRLLNLLCMALSPPLSSLQLHTFPLLDGGQTRVQPVSVREVAQCFALAVSEAKSIGKTYDLVGPMAITWREMVETVSRAQGEVPVYEDFPMLVVLRGLLNLAALVLPVVVVAGLLTGWLGWFAGTLLAFLWCVLAMTAWRWHRLILFSMPSGPLWLLSATLDVIAPSYLNFGEQLKMAQEDNVGDPRPATEVFDYVPESFEAGVARIVRPAAVISETAVALS